MSPMNQYEIFYSAFTLERSVHEVPTKWKCEMENGQLITHSGSVECFGVGVWKRKMCQDEIQHNELHVLCNYEPTTPQNEESLCKELFFLPSSWHYYDNTFISALVAGAVFSTEKPLQNLDNSSTMEPTRQSSHLSREINRKQLRRWVSIMET